MWCIRRERREGRTGVRDPRSLESLTSVSPQGTESTAAFSLFSDVDSGPSKVGVFTWRSEAQMVQWEVQLTSGRPRLSCVADSV